MKHAIVLLALLTITLSSCEQYSNPVEPTSSSTFIGGLGSQRTYLTTEKWFKPYTDTPFVAIPDSLLGRVTLGDSLRRMGVVAIKQESESVRDFDTAYYNSWHLPLPRFLYKMTEGNGHSYNLYDEVGELLAKGTYSTPTTYGYNAWYEDASQVQSVFPKEDWASTPPLPWLKKPLQIGETWVRYELRDASSGTLWHQKSVKVLAQVDVTTRAGTFRAFKLVIFSLGESSPESSTEFEYYVPNIGLVLYEVDRPSLYRTTTSSGSGGSTTINFRQVIRKELISYSVVP